MINLWCHRLDMPPGSTYADGANVLMLQLRSQSFQPFPDEIPQKYNSMKKALMKKKRGWPVTTGKGTLIGVRLLDAPLACLDEWIEGQDELDLNRPEAIRRLIEIG